jgi:hypothetical protein
MDVRCNSGLSDFQKHACVNICDDKEPPDIEKRVIGNLTILIPDTYLRMHVQEVAESKLVNSPISPVYWLHMSDLATQVHAQYLDN